MIKSLINWSFFQHYIFYKKWIRFG